MKSYIKFLWQNKLYTVIEMLGLTLSLAFVIYIGCYTVQHMSIVNSHPDRERMYVLGMTDSYGMTWGFPNLIRERIPEVEQVAEYYPSMISKGGGGMIECNGTKTIYSSQICVDSTFFKMFPKIEFLMGSPKVLNDKDAVILTETFARKIFPDGEFKRVATQTKTIIAGVVKDFDHSLFPNPDMICGADGNESPKQWAPEFDMIGCCIPIIKVREGTDIDALYTKLENICKEVYADYYGTHFYKQLKLTRWDKIYFGHPSTAFNRESYNDMIALICVAVLLLISAVVNFINLNTALVGRRAKEMAVRRLLGSSGRDIMWRYFCESALIVAVAMFFAIIIAVWLAPHLNSLVSNVLKVNIAFTPLYIVGYLILTLIIAFISAVLPAVLASRYKPIDIVKGTFRKDSKRIWSKLFITVQTAIAVFLISMSLLMQMQFDASLNRDMNCNIDNKFALAFTRYIQNPPYSLDDKLRELPCVKRVGRATGFPCGNAFTQTVTAASGEEISYRVFSMDSTAFSMFDFETIKDYNTPLMNSVWFGSTAFAASGFDDNNHNISTTLTQKSASYDHTAGVIKDVPTQIHNTGVEENMIVSVTDLTYMPIYNLIIETVGDNDEAYRQITDVARDYIIKAVGCYVEPTYCDFLTDLRRNALESRENGMRMIQIFMALAVVISMLGMLAMSIYDARNRARDIAVRKVYGSTVMNESLNGILSYMRYIAADCIIGIPFAVWVGDKYLEQFIVKITGYWWIYIVSVFLIIIIALISTFWQIFTAARINPTEALNKE